MKNKNKVIELESVTLKNWQLAAITGGAFLVYFTYSFFSDGYYQHDEAAHYLNMRSFWYDPSVIMGNWAKPGYKILYVPFSLLGPSALIVVNSLVTSLTCYVTYKLSQAIGLKIPILAFIFLALQPFWLQLSFRNYSEFITALILICSVYAHHKNKYWVAALLLSYTATIRQEMYPVIAIYFFYLAYRKQWIPMLCLGVFPLIINGIGWMQSGDPLSLVNQIIGKSQTIGNAYPRQGGDHYFKMALTVYGALTLTFFMAYIATGLFHKRKWHWFIFFPAVAFFGMHVIFNIKTLDFGPATGGNLRYLVIISPLLAVLGNIAVERMLVFKSFKEKKWVFFVLVSFAFAVLIFLSYAHNNIKFTGQKDLFPFLTVVLSVGLAAISLPSKKFVYASLGIAIFSVLVTVKPYKITAEDTSCRQFVEWAKHSNIEERPLLLNHTMIYYFYGKVAEDFKNGAERINETTVSEAEPGTYIIWDSHYSYRPNLRSGSLKHTYFLERPEEFRLVINPIITPDQRFGIFVFEKLVPKKS